MPRLDAVLVAARLDYLNAPETHGYDVEGLVTRRIREIRESLKRSQERLANVRCEASNA